MSYCCCCCPFICSYGHRLAAEAEALWQNNKRRRTFILLLLFFVCVLFCQQQRDDGNNKSIDVPCAHFLPCRFPSGHEKHKSNYYYLVPFFYSLSCSLSLHYLSWGRRMLLCVVYGSKSPTESQARFSRSCQRFHSQVQTHRVQYNKWKNVFVVLLSLPLRKRLKLCFIV